MRDRERGGGKTRGTNENKTLVEVDGGGGKKCSDEIAGEPLGIRRDVPFRTALNTVLAADRKK